VITEKHNDENANTEKTSTQLLHLVFGGELTDLLVQISEGNAGD
jgi:hypothetical protein